ncbi:MAG: hypothetical protein ACREOO_26980 [bacterium]
MKPKHIKVALWVAVKIKRGFLEEVKAFSSESEALKQEQDWRKMMNPDYDETGIFQIKKVNC